MRSKRAGNASEHAWPINATAAVSQQAEHRDRSRQKTTEDKLATSASHTGRRRLMHTSTVPWPASAARLQLRPISVLRLWISEDLIQALPELGWI